MVPPRLPARVYYYFVRVYTTRWWRYVGTVVGWVELEPRCQTVDVTINDDRACQLFRHAMVFCVRGVRFSFTNISIFFFFCVPGEMASEKDDKGDG